MKENTRNFFLNMKLFTIPIIDVNIRRCPQRNT